MDTVVSSAENNWAVWINEPAAKWMAVAQIVCTTIQEEDAKKKCYDNGIKDIPCGDCYGAEEEEGQQKGQCCYTCNRVIQAYEKSGQHVTITPYYMNAWDQCKDCYKNGYYIKDYFYCPKQAG